MSLMWRAVWLAATQETRDELVELARLGERLLRGLRGTIPSPSATTMTNATSSDVFASWQDAYDASAAQVGGMLAGVLFAGVSGFDLRSDVIVRALDAGTAPAWDAILATARGRQLAPDVAAALDIDAARGRQLDTGGEDQRTQSTYHRAWWARFLARQPAATSPAQQPPLPGTTTPVRPADTSSASSGLGGAVVVAIVVYLASRKRRGR